jgi:diaminopimelate decarboxylase
MLSRRHGSLWVEEVRLTTLLEAGAATPLYVYSLGSVRTAYRAYEGATRGLDGMIGYAIKANHNAALLRELARLGAGAVVVSRHELEHALACGFQGRRTLLHGNGKRREDIEAALRAGALVSIDSPFDLEHVAAAASELGVRARCLLRVNPDIDPHVHPYISTGLRDSKFGMSEACIAELRPRLTGLSSVEVVGLHAHLGSMLEEVSPYVDAARLLVPIALALREDGHPVSLLDLGGGLGIDYRHAGRPPLPPAALVDAVRPLLARAGLGLVLEPGRSIVGPAGLLVGRVIGVKQGAGKGFVVLDASMAQLIRPSLYGAYHHIVLLEERAAAPEATFDVVGPICESGDFLGQDRRLGTPAEGDGVAILDAGAYGTTMASRYNLNLFAAEYVVDGASVRRTRRAEGYPDFAGTFVDEPVPLAR